MVILLFLFSVPVYAADSVKIIINKKVNKLAFIKNGVVEKIFPVATGRLPGYTPEGTFKIVRKLVKPAYRKLGIPGGSPKNPLGVRWLGLNARGTSGGTYGIHGTNTPSSIGKHASGGCVRMLNKDVLWLYEQVPAQTVVEIINRDWELEQKPVNISVNGVVIKDPGFKAYNEDKRVMVPARLVAQKMGCTVYWPPEQKKITFVYGKNAMSATIGSWVIYNNSVMKRMDVVASLKNGEVWLPVRNLAECLGFYVGWDGENNTVLLSK